MTLGYVGQRISNGLQIWCGNQADLAMACSGRIVLYGTKASTGMGTGTGIGSLFELV